MHKPSEVEYRVAREQWHLEMALSAESESAASAHIELARRYADYAYPASVIETLGSA